MLDRITFTGADDGTAIADLLQISDQFSCVEWGILYSRSHCGSIRYPSVKWINSFRRSLDGAKASLHLCGGPVIELLTGHVGIVVDEIAALFQRIQLNFHGQSSEFDPVKMHERLAHFGRDKQIIFQVDDARGGDYLRAMLEENERTGERLDVVPLYDYSHGGGMLPDEWPEADFHDGMSQLYHGYAGGLGPDNLPDELTQIIRAANDADFWIDMESNVRSINGKIFDLQKCRQVLQSCANFVGQ